jgi:hypothetical protein
VGDEFMKKRAFIGLIGLVVAVCLFGAYEVIKMNNEQLLKARSEKVEHMRLEPSEVTWNNQIYVLQDTGNPENYTKTVGKFLGVASDPGSQLFKEKAYEIINTPPSKEIALEAPHSQYIRAIAKQKG